MTDRLAEIRQRCEAATPGPWYPKATDDACCMNARYVSLVPGEWRHDDGRGMAEPADYASVVAITLLQSPRLACVSDERWDENTLFIAHAREDLPALLEVVEAAVKARLAARLEAEARETWEHGGDSAKYDAAIQDAVDAEIAFLETVDRFMEAKND